jgi:hypothetical protein
MRQTQRANMKYSTMQLKMILDKSLSTQNRERLSNSICGRYFLFDFGGLDEIAQSFTSDATAGGILAQSITRSANRSAAPLVFFCCLWYSQARPEERRKLLVNNGCRVATIKSRASANPIFCM